MTDRTDRRRWMPEGGRGGASDARLPKTLLVIDDDPLARRLVSHALGERYRVVEAWDFESAMIALGEGPLDLVLLDLHLPPHLGAPREGVRVHRHLRERIPSVPVVIATADADPQLREGLLREGAREVLGKPVDGGELVRVVRALLSD